MNRTVPKRSRSQRAIPGRSSSSVNSYERTHSIPCSTGSMTSSSRSLSVNFSREVVPLGGPYCLAEMKIISFIYEPKLVQILLEHLELWPALTCFLVIATGKGRPLSSHKQKPTDEIICGLIEDG